MPTASSHLFKWSGIKQVYKGKINTLKRSRSWLFERCLFVRALDPTSFPGSLVFRSSDHSFLRLQGREEGCSWPSLTCLIGSLIMHAWICRFRILIFSIWTYLVMETEALFTGLKLESLLVCLKWIKMTTGSSHLDPATRMNLFEFSNRAVVLSFSLSFFVNFNYWRYGTPMSKDVI